MQKDCSNHMVGGGFFVRLAAYLVDAVVVFAGLIPVRLFVNGIVSFLPESLTNGILFQYTLKDIILYLCGAAYFIVLTYYTGATLGKRLMNLRVTAQDGQKPTFFNIVYRETVGRFLSGAVLYIGYIMIGVDKEKRGLHDVLCDTRVIYEKTVKVTYIPPRMPNPPYPGTGYRPQPGPGPGPVGPQAGPYQEGVSQNEPRGL